MSKDYAEAKLRADLNPGLPPLSGMTTRRLMDLRKRCLATGVWYSPIDKNGPGYYMCDILAELSTREHIPNKKEASALRRARAGRREKKVLAY